MDGQFLHELQTKLSQKVAVEEGIDPTDHGQWDAWLGNEAVSCDVRISQRRTLSDHPHIGEHSPVPYRDAENVDWDFAFCLDQDKKQNTLLAQPNLQRSAANGRFEQYYELVIRALQLSNNAEKIERIEQIIALSDKHQNLIKGYKSRQLLMNTALESGDSDKLLVAFDGVRRCRNGDGHF